MPSVKPICCYALLILALCGSPLVSASAPNFLCTVSADNFPGFEDGTLESKTVTLSGMQGEVGGQVTVYENALFRFRLITGRSQIQNGVVTLMDFYVEAQDLGNSHSIRAASASYAGGNQHARLELVTYAPKSDWYEGIVIFKCTGSL